MSDWPVYVVLWCAKTAGRAMRWVRLRLGVRS